MDAKHVPSGSIRINIFLSGRQAKLRALENAFDSLVERRVLPARLGQEPGRDAVVSFQAIGDGLELSVIPGGMGDSEEVSIDIFQLEPHGKRTEPFDSVLDFSIKLIDGVLVLFVVFPVVPAQMLAGLPGIFSMVGQRVELMVAHDGFRFS